MAEGFARPQKSQRRAPETSGRQIASADGDARLAGRQTPSDRTQFSRSGSDRPDFQPTVSDQTAQLHAHLHLHQHEHIQQDPAAVAQLAGEPPSRIRRGAQGGRAESSSSRRVQRGIAQSGACCIPASGEEIGQFHFHRRRERVCTVRMRLLPSVSTLEAN